MVFSSIVFLFIFLPLVLIVYYAISYKFRNLFLTLASLFFYAWGEQKLVMLMLFSIAVNYIGGIWIDNMRRAGKYAWSKAILLLFVSIHLLILAYFKYSNFFIDSINTTGLFRMSSLNEIVLPIGISFFTFQGMSYLIDIYYEKVTSQKNLISLAAYISMFPQLIAGPIVRYIDVSRQIDSVRPFVPLSFRQGIIRFITGLFKKVIIANQTGLLADLAFDNAGDLGTLALWIGVICYSFQIYYDFSGYSDMAIGLGKMFGFDFLENFEHPYISTSIQEFWRRWHISLSTWFRDYLYIPLGGNRKGGIRTYINLIFVFFVTGLWHGASWNFIIWGLFHGFFLILERLGLQSVLKKVPAIFAHLYLLLVVLIGWVFFRAETLGDALFYLQRMFFYVGTGNALIFQYFNWYFACTLVLAILFSTNFKEYIKNKTGRMVKEPIRTRLSLPFYLLLFFICLLELAESNYNPFIYFRF